MRNLFDRLKPEFKEILKNEKIKFPYLVIKLETTLAMNFFFMSLKLSDVYELKAFFNIKIDLTEIKKLFDEN